MVEVARNRELCEQRFSRGIPLGPVAGDRRRPEPPRHHHHLPRRRGDLRPPPVQARAPVQDGPLQGLPLLGRRDPLEIRRSTTARRRPRRPSTSPAACADYLNETLGGASTYADRPFAGKVEFQEKFGVPGKVEWAINWTPVARRLHPVLLQHRAHARGRHPRGGLLGRDPEGHPRLWRAGRTTARPSEITREDLLTGGCALVSCFIREPEFVGQTKDRLATTEAAAAGRGRGARPLRQLAGRGHQVRGRDPRLPRAARRGTPAPPAGEGDRSASPPPRSCACPASWSTAPPPTRDGHRAVHRRGRLGRRLGQDGARPQDPGAAAAAGQDPERAGRGLVQAGHERRDQRPVRRRSASAWAPSSTSTTCATTRSSS